VDARTEREAEPRRCTRPFGRPAEQGTAWMAAPVVIAPCGRGGGGIGPIPAQRRTKRARARSLREFAAPYQAWQASPFRLRFSHVYFEVVDPVMAGRPVTDVVHL
jgi:hypothetical protein